MASTDNGNSTVEAQVELRSVTTSNDEVSHSVPSSIICQRFSMVFGKKIDWVSLRKICKEWIRKPMNMALCVWITYVAISSVILFLVMTGMLNSVLPKKSQRDALAEINNQILNALFTLLSLYLHPKRFYHFVLLCRWRHNDISRLRKIHCKNGTEKPDERAHMMVVVVLLNVNCFVQYALCGLNWGYKRSERPAIGVGLCIAVSIASSVISTVYSIISPLGKEYESEVDQEAQEQTAHFDINRAIHPRMKSLEKRFSFALRNEQRVVENRPEWRGSLFDFWDDISLVFPSLFCSFCVFGWNVERLGFGNMYVHIATFIVLCLAPFWIFNLAANNIDNLAVREVLGFMGILLCIFGLLYGGFWRIQMRKRFNLPASNICCGNPAVTDCAQWLFCCSCSLAQEVRTVNFYYIVEDKFYRNQIDESDPPVLSPLPREDVSIQLKSGPSSPLWNSSSPPKLQTTNFPSPSRFSEGNYSLDGQFSIVEEEESSKSGKDSIMIPPVPSSIQREDQAPPV